jgi:hypothetical protein
MASVSWAFAKKPEEVTVTRARKNLLIMAISLVVNVFIVYVI